MDKPKRHPLLMEAKHHILRKWCSAKYPIFARPMFENQSTRISSSTKPLEHQSMTHRLFDIFIPTVRAADDKGLLPGTHPTEKSDGKVVSQPPASLVSDEEVQQYLDKETGRERLSVMWHLDHKNHLSPELDFVVSSVKMSTITTFAACALVGSRNAREEFVRKNQHTKFQTKYRALRAYQDNLFMSGLKFGSKWGFKVAVFSSIFLATSQSIAVYRNKTSVFEYIAGGALTAALLKLNLGLKGFVAGGIIGGTIGLGVGMLFHGMMWLNNETQEQRHYWAIHDLLQQKKELKIMVAGPESS